MARERLYLVDEAHAEAVLVARAYGNGWDWIASPRHLTDWLERRDRTAAYSRDGGPTVLAVLSGMQVDALRSEGRRLVEPLPQTVDAAVQIATAIDLSRKVRRLTGAG